jgi:glycosyltransferase involved in cell wall biosynthesis
LTTKEVKVIANGSINGVDTEYFKNNFTQEEQRNIREKYSIAKDDFVITFIGRIVKDKGINELVESFSILNEKYENLKLLLVGDYEEHLNPINRENKILIDELKNIITVGFQKDIREFLAISDLFVLPSYREGLPNSLIEAGSFGVPLVATNINGCNEIIADNVTGILIEKKDTNSLKNAIETLVVDKELYSYIKSNVRDRMVERYNQNDFWKALKDEFENIL